MKGTFSSNVDLRNGEGRVDGNEGRYNEDLLLLLLFSVFVFASVEFTQFTTCVSRTLGALLFRKRRLF